MCVCIYVCVYDVCIHTCAIVHIQKSKDNFVESVLIYDFSKALGVEKTGENLSWLQNILSVNELIKHHFKDGG